MNKMVKELTTQQRKYIDLVGNRIDNFPKIERLPESVEESRKLTKSLIYQGEVGCHNPEYFSKLYDLSHKLIHQLNERAIKNRGDGN